MTRPRSTAPAPALLGRERAPVLGVDLGLPPGHGDGRLVGLALCLASAILTVGVAAIAIDQLLTSAAAIPPTAAGRAASPD